MRQSLIGARSADGVSEQALQPLDQSLRLNSDEDPIHVMCIFVVETVRSLNALGDLVGLRYEQCGWPGNSCFEDAVVGRVKSLHTLDGVVHNGCLQTSGAAHGVAIVWWYPSAAALCATGTRKSFWDHEVDRYPMLLIQVPGWLCTGSGMKPAALMATSTSGSSPSVRVSIARSLSLVASASATSALPVRK